MNKYFKRLIGAIIIWGVGHYKKTYLEIARIKAARDILELANTTRKGMRGIVFCLIAIGIMSAGVAMFITGLTLLLMLMFMPAKNELPIAVWVFPFGLCVSGFICFAPFFAFTFFVVLSEGKWMEMLKKNKLIGSFIIRALHEAEITMSKY